MRYFVPGNIILLGEYAILEQNSVALTASVLPCAQGEINQSHLLTGEQGDVKWEYALDSTLTNSTQGNIFASCWHVLLAYCRDRELSLNKTGVHVNTGLFAGDKGKLGFGSSAASTVACIKGLLNGQSWGDSISLSDFRKLTYDAHSMFQGKNGSGYDVYTSTSEGLNLYTNGTERNIASIDISFLPTLYVYQSSHSVSTVSAVKKYKQWRSLNTPAVRDFLTISNRLIQQFSQADRWALAMDIFKESTDLYLDLGEKIGVSAEIKLTFLYKSAGIFETNFLTVLGGLKA